MKIHHILSLAALLSMPAAAQELHTSYFLNSSVNRHEMNPAMLDKSYVSMPLVLGNLNVGTTGNVGLKSFVYEMDPSWQGYNLNGGNNLTTFMHPSVDANKFLGGLKDNNRISANLKYQIFDVETSKDRYYLAVSDRVSFNVKVLGIGNYNVSYDGYDSGVISVKGNKIYAKKKGSTKIGIYDKKIKVVVTDLIDKMPNKYNYSRRYLSCGAFSQDEEKLLDKILASRISDAGFGTRAGVVAAARFLTLEFPYKISYFSENGRLTDYNRIVGLG